MTQLTNPILRCFKIITTDRHGKQIVRVYSNDLEANVRFDGYAESGDYVNVKLWAVYSEGSELLAEHETTDEYKIEIDAKPMNFHPGVIDTGLN